MEILIACDKFKGSLSGQEACEAIATGLQASVAFSSLHQLTLLPITDGGEGLTKALTETLRGTLHSLQVEDALGREVTATYGLAQRDDELVGILEMAETSGLWRIDEEDRDLWNASSFGTGQMIRELTRQRVDRILLGIGGSAVNDGGAGMAAALGGRFFDHHGIELKRVCPRSLQECDRVDLSSRLALPPIEVACDVENPLLGVTGATAIYARQKGAEPADLRELEAVLERLVSLTDAQKEAGLPGAGAAGGLGWGMMVFCQGKLCPGFELFAKTANLAKAISQADLVITGEGSIDAQTSYGKAPAGVAKMARKAGKPVVAIGGRVTREGRESDLFDAVESLEDFGLSLEQSMKQAAELLGKKACELLPLILTMKKR